MRESVGAAKIRIAMKAAALNLLSELKSRRNHNALYLSAVVPIKAKMVMAANGTTLFLSTTTDRISRKGILCVDLLLQLFLSKMYSDCNRIE